MGFFSLHLFLYLKANICCFDYHIITCGGHKRFVALLVWHSFCCFSLTPYAVMFEKRQISKRKENWTPEKDFVCRVSFSVLLQTTTRKKQFVVL
jgi:hypothetical protein